MKKITFPILLLSLVIVSTSSFAETESKIEEQRVEAPSYGSKVGHKALNGFANMTTAILEIPKEIINTTNNSNMVLGPIAGGLKGMINTVGRLGIGVIDLITAPIPTKPVVQPVYVWDDFDVDTTYGDVFRLQE